MRWELVPGHTLRADLRPDAAARAEEDGTWTPSWWTNLAGEDDPVAGWASLSPQELRRHQVKWGMLLLRRLCRTLAFLHGEGIVHRDLKPENILVRPDGVPVLVDFGLASIFSGDQSRESFETPLFGAGTVAYMAPELIEGRLPDARADLYSIGCMLYELWAGRPPFIGRAPKELLLAHLSEAPTPLAELADDVPESVSRLALRLLAKQPGQRPGYAEEVTTAMGGLEGQDEPSRSWPKARAYLHRPELMGRKPEFDQLVQAVLGPQQTHAGVLLGGASGIGKTRLLIELANEAKRTNRLVLTGQCLPPMGSTGTGAPLQGLRRPLQEVVDRCAALGEGNGDILGRNRRLLSLYEPAFAQLTAQPNEVDPTGLPAQLLQRQLFAALQSLFEAVAGKDRLMLAIDDLQWADELTLGYLKQAFSQPPEATRHVAVVGAYRIQEQSTAPLKPLLQQPGVLHLELAQLGSAPVTAMVADILSLDNPPQSWISALVGRAEGNPFFVGEYLRHAVERGLLLREPLGGWLVATSGPELLPLPTTVRGLLLERLGSLSPAGRKIAEALAVLGREAGDLLLRKVAQLQDAQHLEAVDEGLRRKILEQQETGLRFAHDQLRELCYAEIETDRRTRLHHAAASTLEEMGEAAQPQLWASLGAHWEGAGETDRAWKAYLARGKAAAAQALFVEAEQQLRAGLRLDGGQAQERARARMELGSHVLQRRGMVTEAEKEHQQALAEARQGGFQELIVFGLIELGYNRKALGQSEEARALTLEALQLAKAGGFERFRAIALGNLAVFATEEGDFEAARDYFEQTWEAVRQGGFVPEEMKLLNNYGLWLINQGQPAKALELLERALQFARDGKHRWLEENLTANAAFALKELGRLPEARDLYLKAAEMSRETGHEIGLSIALLNFGSVLHEQRMSTEALPALAEAQALSRKIHNKRFEAVALTVQAMVKTELGRFEEAMSDFAEGLRLLRDVRDRINEGLTLVGLSRLVRLSSGDPLLPTSLLQRADELLEQGGNRQGQGSVRCEQGFQALACGDDAGPWLEQAQCIAQELDTAPTSLLGQQLQRLERAVQVAQQGQPGALLRGEAAETLPEPIRSRLAASRDP